MRLRALPKNWRVTSDEEGAVEFVTRKVALEHYAELVALGLTNVTIEPINRQTELF